MPPHVKISPEMIVHAAYEIAKQDGMGKLNARLLAKHLHCSTQPIFSHFNTMDELKNAVFSKVLREYQCQFEQLKEDEKLLINVGMTYIHFAKQEPELFRLLFMSPQYRKAYVHDYLSIIRETTLSNAVLKAIDSPRTEQSDQVFIDMWLYTHGLASMLVNNQIEMDKTEIERMLTRVYREMLSRLKEEKNG